MRVPRVVRDRRRDWREIFYAPGGIPLGGLSTITIATSRCRVSVSFQAISLRSNLGQGGRPPLNEFP